jgi:hypothetical protein
MDNYPNTGDIIDAKIYSSNANGGYWEEVEVTGRAFSDNGGLMILVKELEAADEGEQAAGEFPIHAIPALSLLREIPEEVVELPPATKIITRAQVCDSTTCPSCEGHNISSHDCGCLCRIPNHSCWSFPKCNDCGFTAGGAAGNSDGGIWISFGTLGAAQEYTITPLPKPNVVEMAIEYAQCHSKDQVLTVVVHFTAKFDFSEDYFIEKSEELLFDQRLCGSHFRIESPEVAAELIHAFACDTIDWSKHSGYRRGNDELYVAFTVEALDGEKNHLEALRNFESDLKIFCIENNFDADQVNVHANRYDF